MKMDKLLREGGDSLKVITDLKRLHIIMCQFKKKIHRDQFNESQSMFLRDLKLLD